MYYCNDCDYMLSETDLTSFKGAFYCPKCRQKMVMMEGEHVSLSQSYFSSEGSDGNVKTNAVFAQHDSSVESVDMIELECKDSLKDNPSNCNAMFTLASRYYTKGKIDEAKELCYQVIVLDSDHSGALQLLDRIQSQDTQSHHLKHLEKRAEAALGQQQYPEVERYCRELLSSDPSSIGARQLLATSFQEQDRYDDALPILLELEKMIPNNAYVYFNLGVLYYMKKDQEISKKYFFLAESKSDDPNLKNAIKGYLK